MPNTMTPAEALDVVLAIAEQWAENAEEHFNRGVEPDDSDEQLIEIAPDNLGLTRQVRDVWRALDVLRRDRG
jgi:hypothetical protein